MKVSKISRINFLFEAMLTFFVSGLIISAFFSSWLGDTAVICTAAILTFVSLAYSVYPTAQKNM